MKNSIGRYRILIVIFIAIELIIGFAIYFALDINDAILVLGFTIINVASALVFLTFLVSENRKQIVSTARVLGFEASEALEFATVGILMLDDNLSTIWASESIDITKAKAVGTSVYDWLPEFDIFINKPWKIIDKKIKGKAYKIKYLKETRTLIIDDTSLLDRALLTNIDEGTVISFIRIDNFQETIQSADEETALNINVAVRGNITTWAKKFGIFFKSYATDGFIIVSDNETFKKVEADKFSFIKSIKEECAKIGADITLSIGIGKGTPSIIKLTELATDAIERAEARGGDQVVISNYADELKYYGGNSEAKTTKSKTKIRHFAKDVVSIIKKSDNVLIMGHKFGDYDAIAAGLAMASLARSYGKRVKVIMDEPNLDIKAIRHLERYMGTGYIANNVIAPIQAVKYMNENTLLIVVDTSVPNRVEVPELLTMTNNIIVLDHHRRGANKIDNAKLEYIDAGASSTSEIVTEIIEFNNVELPLSQEEINLLLTGIVMDTNNFKSTRVGPRTFIASSILKEWGGDQTVADALLKDTYEEYQLKAAVVAAGSKIDSHTIIALVPATKKVHGSMLAQIAQQILEIEGIRASFVLGVNNHGYAACSARSNGDINVQVIMEKVGGGGHFTAAATQSKTLSLKELEEAVVKAYGE